MIEVHFSNVACAVTTVSGNMEVMSDYVLQEMKTNVDFSDCRSWAAFFAIIKVLRYKGRCVLVRKRGNCRGGQSPLEQLLRMFWQ